MRPIALLTRDVPAVVDQCLRAEAVGHDVVIEHALTNEDADVLRDSLRKHNWVAFVADGSVLPRRSGVDERPLVDDSVVPFVSPESLRAEVDLPHAGRIRGLALPTGVTLIVGGGYHGKSTLLRALERGVYNHFPGDGREYVVSEPSLVKVRAEDGRSVAGVDISTFIDGLPGGQDTHVFTTSNASGSTSQAASIMEGVGGRSLDPRAGRGHIGHELHDPRSTHAGVGSERRRAHHSLRRSRQGSLGRARCLLGHRSGRKW